MIHAFHGSGGRRALPEEVAGYARRERGVEAVPGFGESVAARGVRGLRARAALRKARA